MSDDDLDKPGHQQGAVQTHGYQEESDWFVDMKAAAPAEPQVHATARYEEEYGRYIDGGLAPGGPSGEARWFVDEAQRYSARA